MQCSKSSPNDAQHSTLSPTQQGRQRSLRTHRRADPVLSWLTAAATSVGLGSPAPSPPFPSPSLDSPLQGEPQPMSTGQHSISQPQNPQQMLSAAHQLG